MSEHYDPRDVDSPYYDPALDPDMVELGEWYADTAGNDYAPPPDGWEYVPDAQGNPRVDADGDVYLHSTSSPDEYCLYDPTTDEAYESDIDFSAVAAGAARQLLEDHPRALEYLAEAEGLIGEDGQLLEDNNKPSPDQTYVPKTARDNSLNDSLDAALDEALAPPGDGGERGLT